jgi:hypothetical protein
MAIKFHNPKSVPLAGKYSLGAEVPPGARVLYVAGQVGLDSKGKLQPTFEKQAVQAWKNIGQVLKAAGMGYRTSSRSPASSPTAATSWPTARHASSSSRRSPIRLDLLVVAGPCRSRHAGRDRSGGRQRLTMTDSLKVALAQLNPKVGDVAGNLAKVRAARAEARSRAPTWC